MPPRLVPTDEQTTQPAGSVHRATRLSVGVRPRLQAEELGIAPPTRHELVVRALLDNLTLVQHDDEIGEAHGRHAVGDVIVTAPTPTATSREVA